MLGCGAVALDRPGSLCDKAAMNPFPSNGCDVGQPLALQHAFEQVLRRLLTEPLEIRELAEAFRVHRSKVRTILATIEGCVPVGRRVRVPLWSMPARWLQERGHLPRH